MTPSDKALTTWNAFLLHPSGGLLWHWRAWRRQHRWQAFHSTLNDWLRKWQTGASGIVLIGCSAGWSLPDEFLRRFNDVVLVDPDTIGKRLFRQRHRHIAARAVDIDVFSTAVDGAMLRHIFPNHALLFCNVLGQIAPDNEQNAQTWCRDLQQKLTGFEWASYHEICSCNKTPEVIAHQRCEAGLLLEDIAGRFWRAGSVEVTTHQTEWFATDLPSQCVPWPFAKNRWHLVQWRQHR